MKIASRVLTLLILVLISQTVVFAQDLSQYRGFPFGMTLAKLTTRIDRNPADATVVVRRPGLIQELAWWPTPERSASQEPEAVPKIVFSFFNGNLYGISVSYDRDATKGLTVTDMVRAISARYGSVTELRREITGNDVPGDWGDSSVARWENADHRIELFHAGKWSDFRLVMVSKTIEVKALVASALSISLDRAEAPGIEAERERKELADMELARQKNKRVFRP